MEVKMIIRKAKEKDIPRILELLEQVLQIHADIRPDIFIPGTTKYTIDELRELLKHKEKPIYVEYVKNEAKELGCYEVTLNVWAGNTPAEKFYEKMGMRTKERQMEYILEEK